MTTSLTFVISKAFVTDLQPGECRAFCGKVSDVIWVGSSPDYLHTRAVVIVEVVSAAGLLSRRVEE